MLVPLPVTRGRELYEEYEAHPSLGNVVDVYRMRPLSECQLALFLH